MFVAQYAAIQGRYKDYQKGGGESDKPWAGLGSGWTEHGDTFMRWPARPEVYGRE